MKQIFDHLRAATSRTATDAISFSRVDRDLGLSPPQRIRSTQVHNSRCVRSRIIYRLYRTLRARSACVPHRVDLNRQSTRHGTQGRSRTRHLRLGSPRASHRILYEHATGAPRKGRPRAVHVDTAGRRHTLQRPHHIHANTVGPSRIPPLSGRAPISIPAFKG